MKQVQQNYRTGELRVSDVPAPRVGTRSLLVATRISLISSGTEKQLMDLAKASLAGKAMARPDLVRQTLRKAQADGLRPTIERVFAKLDTSIPLGYSLAGEIVECGRGAGGYAVGDRVACAGAGLANHAEFNAVPKNLTVRIPDNVSDEDASFVTLGAIALQGVRQAQPTLGERVVVMGLGLIGLLTVQLLKANGCAVLGFDPNLERTKLAEALGADVVVSDALSDAVSGFTEGHGADAVIVTASTKSNQPINQAAEISRLKGRIVVVGLVGMTIDREPFYKRELDLRLSMSYGPGRHDPDYELSGHDYPLAYVRWTEQRNMEAFLGLIAEGRVTPQSLITHRFPIHEGESAYSLMVRGEPHLAMLLTYPDNSTTPIVREIARVAPPAQDGRLGIGFVGLGNYAKGVLLPAVKKFANVRLTHVATSTGISASNAGQKYGFETVATDPSAVFARDETQAVFIATRHDSHAALTAVALRAGKHVFCEKPLAMNLEQLDDVMDAARHSGSILTVGFNRRFAPLLFKVREALQARSGPLVMLYRINAGEIPADSWIQRDEGGGRIVGEVCHFIDTLAALAESAPVEVQAVAARGRADAVSALIRFADGSTGTIVYSSLGDSSVPKEYIEIFSSGRVAQITDFTHLDLSVNGKTTTMRQAQDKGQSALVSAFLEAARTGGAPPIPYNDLAAVTETTFAVEEALRTGRAVVVEAGQQERASG
ncbi:MAG: bi-domain-containing oxidoreductase [Pseudomonadota bacterium]